jgi:hypothetical protein
MPSFIYYFGNGVLIQQMTTRFIQNVNLIEIRCCFLARLFEEKKSSYCHVTPASASVSGSVKFSVKVFVRVHFSKTIKGIYLKLGILVHSQKRNQLQQGDDPVICISRIICPCFDIVHRN